MNGQETVTHLRSQTRRSAGAPMKSPPGPQRDTHVGLISSGSALTPAQQKALSRTFTQIAFYNPGRLILHHGCGPGADEFAHRCVRGLGGWRIHGHPAHDATGRSPAPTASAHA
jgi:hypothetical protein